MQSSPMVESPYVSIAENLYKMAVRAPMSKTGEGFFRSVF